jgi:hypothetical protein
MTISPALLLLQQRFVEDLPEQVGVDLHIGLQVPTVELSLPATENTGPLRLYVEPADDSVDLDGKPVLDRVAYQYSSGQRLFEDYEKLVGMIVRHFNK